MKATKYISLYEQGAIVEYDAVSNIIDHCPPEEAMQLPEEWQQKIIKVVDRAPKTDEGWGKFSFLFSWSGQEAPPTQDQLRKAYRERVDLYRSHPMLAKS